MAEVIESALVGGILRGVEVVVAGGLVPDDEVSHLDEVVHDARRLGEEIVQFEPDGEMPPWRQTITGEVIGAAAIARARIGTLSEVDPRDVSRVLNDIWKIIDRW